MRGLVVRPARYPGMHPSDDVPFGLVEDEEWRDRISELDAAGKDGLIDYPLTTPIAERKGSLWDFARSLSKRGYVLDSSGYATAFRVNRKQQTDEVLASTFDDFIEKCSRGEDVPEGLACSTNLGCVDVYPEMSGKRNCAEYLAKKFLGPAAELRDRALCMCDDDNDAEMALACRAAYLPSVTSDSMRDLVKSPENGESYRLVVTEEVNGGIVETKSTEKALEAVIEEVRR